MVNDMTEQALQQYVIKQYLKENDHVWSNKFGHYLTK